MSAQTPKLSANDSRLQMGALSSRVFGAGIGLGVVGLGAALAMAAMAAENGWKHFFRAYLVGVLFVLAISLGALFFTAVQHATRAGWGISLRRLMEAISANIIVVFVLFLPILALVVLGHGDLLYSWMAPGAAEHSSLLAGKTAYLNVNFWIVRALVFFAIWIGFSQFWFRNSVRQDATGDVSLTHRMQRWAPIGIALYALTQTFSSVDWIMSLEAEWFSTMFGVYFFAISCCAFWSTLILLVFFLQRNGRLDNEVTLEHWQEMGKLLFGFGIVFHAYIAFSQFMLIWYGNIPEETTWFLVRMVGGWKALFVLLAFGHFAIPFVLLITKHTKRIKFVLAGIAAWMLLMTFVEMILLVHPSVPVELIGQIQSGLLSDVGVVFAEQPEAFGWSPGLMDVAAWIGVVGIAIAFLGRRLGSCSLVAVQDPRLSESLAFENM